jgi:hypothetical protein
MPGTRRPCRSSARSLRWTGRSSLPRLVVGFRRAVGQQLLQERADVSLHLDHPASRPEVGLGALELPLQFHVLNRVRARRSRTTRLRLQTAQSRPVALRSPGRQMRAIQPFAPQQSTELTRPRARISLGHDRQLVLRRILTTRRLLDQLRTRHPRRRDAAPARRETQPAYGSLVSSTGAILLHRPRLLLRVQPILKLRHDSTSDLALRLSDLTADAVSHELGREGPRSAISSAPAQKVLRGSSMKRSEITGAPVEACSRCAYSSQRPLTQSSLAQDRPPHQLLCRRTAYACDGSGGQRAGWRAKR